MCVKKKPRRVTVVRERATVMSRLLPKMYLGTEFVVALFNTRYILLLGTFRTMISSIKLPAILFMFLTI